MTDQEKIANAQERYLRAAHAVQTGVLMILEKETPGIPENFVRAASGPKHLRTGLEMRAADHAGLVKLLLAKGVFTELEYTEAMADAAEEEKVRYEQRVTEVIGQTVSLV